MRIGCAVVVVVLRMVMPLTRSLDGFDHFAPDNQNNAAPYKTWAEPIQIPFEPETASEKNLSI